MGRESIWFCFMTCRGGSVKFGEVFGPEDRVSAKAVVMVMFVGSRDHTERAEMTGLGSVWALILSVLMICKDGESTPGQVMSRNGVVCLSDQLSTPGSTTSFLPM